MEGGGPVRSMTGRPPVEEEAEDTAVPTPPTTGLADRLRGWMASGDGEEEEEEDDASTCWGGWDWFWEGTRKDEEEEEEEEEEEDAEPLREATGVFPSKVS
jgi:hypothetical protein